jgi:curli production assembly/transport component CsgG
LRAVSVRTGEVLTSVTASKTIASQAIGANAFRYVGFKELLQAEAGYTTNEPDQVALQQAIEKAVYSLVLEGVDLKLWNFADTNAGWPLLWQYRQERDGKLDDSAVQAALRSAPAMAPQKIKHTAARGDDADDKALGRGRGARATN